jgi:hypothetical protein
MATQWPFSCLSAPEAETTAALTLNLNLLPRFVALLGCRIELAAADRFVHL